MGFVVTYFLEGVVLMLIAWPMIQRRIGPNLFYGFRTRKTLSSPDIWYPANEFTGRRLFKTGALLCLWSILFIPAFLFGRAGAGFYTGVVPTLTAVSLIDDVIKSFRYLKRL